MSQVIQTRLMNAGTIKLLFSGTIQLILSQETEQSFSKMDLHLIKTIVLKPHISQLTNVEMLV